MRKQREEMMNSKEKPDPFAGEMIYHSYGVGNRNKSEVGEASLEMIPSFGNSGGKKRFAGGNIEGTKGEGGGYPMSTNVNVGNQP